MKIFTPKPVTLEVQVTSKVEARITDAEYDTYWGAAFDRFQKWVDRATDWKNNEVDKIKDEYIKQHKRPDKVYAKSLDLIVKRWEAQNRVSERELDETLKEIDRRRYG